jgi:hypothetical protein
MKSLILTSLYLCKDTLYRWKERPSSPLSRVLVVFFLSLCALSFLANYVLTTKMVVDEIRRQGGDLIVMSDLEDGTAPSKVDLIRDGLSELQVNTQLLILTDVGQGDIGGNKVPIVEYSDHTLSALGDLPMEEYPYLALMPKDSSCKPGPVTMRVGLRDEDSYYFPLVCRQMPEDSMLARVHSRGVILVPEGASGTQNANVVNTNRRYLVRVGEMSYENVNKVQQTLTNLSRLDGTFSTVVGSAQSLEKLDIILGNQAECRAGFSIGIAVIVGILLTALASMEFRQNEYVYTLMKSFGVNPFLLVLTFIGENLVLVGMAFAASIIFFLQTQKIVLGEFFKLRNAILTYSEIEPEVALLGGALIICVLISTIPIAVSAYREIGRVLK